MDGQEQNLEDDRSDIISKALRHHGMDPRGISEAKWTDAEFIGSLGLDPDALHRLPSSIPIINLPEGLQRHIRPFGPWTVNIWTVKTPGGFVAIDTGCTPDDLAYATNGIPPAAVLVTHHDHDHTGGLSVYPDVPVYDSASVAADETFELIGLTWRVCDLTGHSPTGIGFETLLGKTTLLFPGDSIFARSIGKSRLPYSLTIANIVTALERLPDDTVICPGHGPATTVIAEKRHNPFIAPHFR